MSRRAIQRYAEKYLFNPCMRTAIRLGCAPRIFALLETTGRRTGLARRTPVTVAADGDMVWLVAEHGWGCGYVRNISAERSWVPCCQAHLLPSGTCGSPTSATST